MVAAAIVMEDVLDARRDVQVVLHAQVDVAVVAQVHAHTNVPVNAEVHVKTIVVRVVQMLAPGVLIHVDFHVQYLVGHRANNLVALGAPVPATVAVVLVVLVARKTVEPVVIVIVIQDVKIHVTLPVRLHVLEIAAINALEVVVEPYTQRLCNLEKRRKNMKVVKTIDITEELRDFVEARYQEYMSYKDMIDTVLVNHRDDEDDGVILSEPFKAFFKEYRECKVKYDEAMNIIQKDFIPEEFQQEKYRFEVDFALKVIRITTKEV